eukprot:11264978-Heterocapsa_arctica.AAC.1
MGPCKANSEVGGQVDRYNAPRWRGCEEPPPERSKPTRCDDCEQTAEDAWHVTGFVIDVPEDKNAEIVALINLVKLINAKIRYLQSERE